MLNMQSNLPASLNPRNMAIPEAFRKAASGDLSALGPSTEFTLDGGAHALLYPERSDDAALAATPYRAAVVTMADQGYPRVGYHGVNEKGRSMAFFHLAGDFSITIDGQSFSLKAGVPISTRDGQKITISGTGKMFILADGGETNEYPDQ